MGTGATSKGVVSPLPESSLTPAERSLRSRMGAYSLHARYDSHEITANARAASPGSIDYWLAKVDPENALPETERRRRAECAKKAHFAKLAFASARARSKQKGAA